MQSTGRSTKFAATAALALLLVANAQQPGTATPEVHPQLTTSKCSTEAGCVQQNTSVVLDFNYRWLHTADYASCTTSSGLNSTLCPDEATCATNCFVEGTNYTASGISTSGSSMTMRQFMPSSSGVSSVSPRVYLLDNESQDYVMFKLLGQELTFDVDLSTLPCGENGALYLSEMDASGGRNQYQTGGATYGGGYCDAQCPVQNFKNGTLNTNSAGYCCNEMDVLESNSVGRLTSVSPNTQVTDTSTDHLLAAAFTPHPCADDSSNCDKSNSASSLVLSSFPAVFYHVLFSLSRYSTRYSYSLTPSSFLFYPLTSIRWMRIQPIQPGIHQVLGTRWYTGHKQAIYCDHAVHY